jgi:flagellar basal body-associated protein FliL
MMGKMKILLPVLLIAAGGIYKFVLAKPAAKAEEPKPKVHGTIYVLPKDFLVNLADGRYAKLNVAMVFDHGYTGVDEAAGGEGHGAAAEPPEGYGTLSQEALVRDIITDTLTDATAEELTDRKERDHLKEKIAKKIKKHTDVKVHEVLFTDVAVQ